MAKNTLQEKVDGETPEACGELLCPLFSKAAGKCRAINGLRVTKQKIARSCSNDDYDSCARYLVYLLLRSRPNRVDNDWLDAG